MILTTKEFNDILKRNKIKFETNELSALHVEKSKENIEIYFAGEYEDVINMLSCLLLTLSEQQKKTVPQYLKDIEKQISVINQSESSGETETNIINLLERIKRNEKQK